MAVVGQLLVELSANVARLQADMARASGVVEAHTARMAAAAKAASTALAAIGGVALVGTGIAALVNSFESAVNAMADLDDAAEKTGASVEELSSIFNTLAPTGATLENITEVTGKLAKAMREAEDSGSSQAKAFAALGVETKNADGSFKSTGQTLEDVARALSVYADGTNKTVLAQILLGKSGAEALPMLKDLATRTKEAATVSSEAAADAERLSNAWREIKRQGELTAQSIAQMIIPELANLIAQFNAVRKAGGGMWEAFKGMVSPDNALAEAQSTLNGLIERRDRLANDKRPLMAIGRDKNLAEFDAQIKAAQASVNRLKAAVAVTKPPPLMGADASRFLRGAGYGPAPDAPKVDEGASKPAKAVREQTSEVEKLLATMQRQLDTAKDLSEEEKLYQTLARSRFETLNPFQLDALILTARAIDNAKAETEATRELKRANDEAARAALARLEAVDRAESQADEALAREAEAIRNMIDPTRELYAAMERVKTLTAAGLLPEDIGNARVMQLYGQIDAALLKMPEAADKAKNTFDDLGFAFESAFESAVIGGEKASKVVQSLAADVAKFFLRQQVTAPLLSMLGGTFDSAKQGGTLIGQIAGLFGGARANGGPVSAGSAYLVGERGPELFMPKQSGTIVPNGGTAGGTVSVVQHITYGGNDRTGAMILAERVKADTIRTMREASLRGAA